MLAAFFGISLITHENTENYYNRRFLAVLGGQRAPERMGTQLTSRQQKALTVLIRAPTVEAAAREAGIGYSTMRKWLKSDPEFKQAYHAEMDTLLQDASRQARAATGAAVSVLQTVMEDTDTPAAARIAAADKLINHALRLTEAVDVEVRLVELERQMGGDDNT